MHPMRRKDKERDAAFAWQVLRDATYATLAMTDSDGAPYCVPVNHVADEQGNAVYFHCAGAGRKWDILTKEPPVCLSAVSKAELIPGELTTAYNNVAVPYNEIATAVNENGWMNDEQTATEMKALSDTLGFIGKGLTEDISLLDGSDFDALIDYLENEFPPALEELSERVSVPYEAG